MGKEKEGRSKEAAISGHVMMGENYVLLQILHGKYTEKRCQPSEWRWHLQKKPSLSEVYLDQSCDNKQDFNTRMLTGTIIFVIEHSNKISYDGSLQKHI